VSQDKRAQRIQTATQFIASIKNRRAIAEGEFKKLATGALQDAQVLIDLDAELYPEFSYITKVGNSVPKKAE
jgi:hypothetical protein